MSRILNTILGLWSLATRVGDTFHWLSPTVARLTVGVVFFQSGWGKLHDLAKVTDYFTELGLPAPGFQAMLTSTTEFACGSLLLLGLCTRLAALPLIITMTVAIRTALWSQVDSLGSLFGLAEFLYIALLLWLGTAGAGPLSLDWLIERYRGHRATSAMISGHTANATAH